MKLILAATGLFVTLCVVGIACGPKETFCYQEGKTCAEVARDRQFMMMQPDASDAADLEKKCTDSVTGEFIPCPG